MYNSLPPPSGWLQHVSIKVQSHQPLPLFRARQRKVHYLINTVVDGPVKLLRLVTGQHHHKPAGHRGKRKRVGGIEIVSYIRLIIQEEQFKGVLDTLRAMLALNLKVFYDTCSMYTIQFNHVYRMIHIELDEYLLVALFSCTIKKCV